MAKKKILGYVQAPAVSSDKKKAKHPRPYIPREGYTGKLQLVINSNGTVDCRNNTGE